MLSCFYGWGSRGPEERPGVPAACAAGPPVQSTARAARKPQNTQFIGPENIHPVTEPLLLIAALLRPEQEGY